MQTFRQQPPTPNGLRLVSRERCCHHLGQFYPRRWDNMSFTGNQVNTLLGRHNAWLKDATPPPLGEDLRGDDCGGAAEWTQPPVTLCKLICTPGISEMIILEQFNKGKDWSIVSVTTVCYLIGKCWHKLKYPDNTKVCRWITSRVVLLQGTPCAYKCTSKTRGMSAWARQSMYSIIRCVTILHLDSLQPSATWQVFFPFCLL